MTIINLTPHPISFIGEDGNVILRVGPSGSIARVAVTKVPTGDIDGIPVKQSSFGAIEGLPAPEENTIYLVSSIVASRCPEREDVFIPDDSVRDKEGNIIGCKSLGHIDERNGPSQTIKIG